MSRIRTTISGDGTPKEQCEYCGHPFPTTDRLALHKGLEHQDRLEPSEQEAFAAAYDGERDELRLFRLKALVALVFLYFGFLFLYVIFT